MPDWAWVFAIIALLLAVGIGYRWGREAAEGKTREAIRRGDLVPRDPSTRPGDSPTVPTRERRRGDRADGD